MIQKSMLTIWPFSSLLYPLSTVWNADVIAGALAATLDHESKGHPSDGIVVS